MSPFSRATRACVIASFGLVWAVGCKSTPKVSAPEPAPPVARNEVRAPAAPAPAAAVPPRLQTVYFDFERAELRPDARTTLQHNADQLKESSQWTRLTIEGHCDERGSEEYNMALGERRAGAVLRYLKDLGVPASRLYTVSYGENRPAAPGHDEAAWRLNRRAEFELTSAQQAAR
ncbi:MAG TPA: OmpA family protein [Myxococcota bacterium]|nr:OmpA family protein [Myxococcota bacterium]